MTKCHLIALIPCLRGCLWGCLWGMTLSAAAPLAAENSAAPVGIQAAGTQAADTQTAETPAAPESEPQTAAAPATDKKMAKPADTVTGSARVFEGFIPSETISADNAVPFPVDI